jgi:quercetin dioxygenase-like cupin family protein
LNPFKVDFDLLEWERGRPGVRFKAYRLGSRQLRLVEFETTDGDPHWCEQGHIGYVLHGGLEIEVNGRVESLIAGDGLFIPPGAATAHRGVRIVSGTRLLMVEDV